MSTIVRLHTYPDGVPARPDHANVNEITIYAVINGNLDWDNITVALINAANGFVKLNASGDVPLAQIPDTLTGKDADTLDGTELTTITDAIAAAAAINAIAEVTAARGSKASLDARLDVELNDDGTSKAKGSKTSLDARLDISLAENGNIKVGELCWVLQGDAYVQGGLGYCLVGVELAKKTISKVKIYVSTAPTGASLIVDVNKNGTTIFTSQAKRPEIAISGNSDDSDTPDVTALSEGDRLSFDVDQIGSSIPGGDPLLVTVVFT